MQEVLKPIRERREELARDPDKVYEILKKGTENARDAARKTLKELKSAMGINYFE